MRCEEAIANLHLEVDGEFLSALTRQQLHDHVSECPACQRAREELRSLSGMLLEGLPLSPPADFASRVRVRIAKPQARWQQQLVSLSVRPELHLAALACVAGIAFYVSPRMIQAMPRISLTPWWNSLSATLTLPPALRAASTSWVDLFGVWSDALVTKLSTISDILTGYVTMLEPATAWVKGFPSWWAWVGFAFALVFNLILAAPRLSKLRQFAK